VKVACPDSVGPEGLQMSFVSLEGFKVLEGLQMQKKKKKAAMSFSVDLSEFDNDWAIPR
jgi:hypothetical protein